MASRFAQLMKLVQEASAFALGSVLSKSNKGVHWGALGCTGVECSHVELAAHGVKTVEAQVKLFQEADM